MHRRCTTLSRRTRGSGNRKAAVTTKSPRHAPRRYHFRYQKKTLPLIINLILQTYETYTIILLGTVFRSLQIIFSVQFLEKLLCLLRHFSTFQGECCIHQQPLETPSGCYFLSA